MGDQVVSGRANEGRVDGTRTNRIDAGPSERGIVGQALVGISRLFPIPPACVAPLLVAGALLGVLGDVLLRAPDAAALNVAAWITAVAAAVVGVQRFTGASLDTGRAAWLAIGVVFAAGLAWRDAPPLKLLALGSATLTFALAAYRTTAVWVRRAGVVRYASAVAFSTLHVWTSPALALVDATLGTGRVRTGTAAGWRQAAAIARGLLIAAPLLFIFGALFMAADAVFETLVLNVVQIDLEPIVTHGILIAVCAWLATGYIRGFVAGTEPPILGMLWGDGDRPFPAKRPTLGITEVGTALGALGLLFLVFVLVQFRYLFGGDALVQVTPNLTYAEYARRGFFELVFVVVLVVPILLAADWLVDRQSRRDDLVFRVVASVQVGLVLAITASALQRLRLYHAGYGLTESRLYAMALLLWIGAMLIWFAATALRGRRRAFAFGTLVSGLATIALLFAINPDAVVARTNLARLASADASGDFDVAYATSLSADAVPLLIDALAGLPPDVQCPVARRLLRRWPPNRATSFRSWNWSAARGAALVRQHEAQLRSFVGSDDTCPPAGH